MKRNTKINQRPSMNPSNLRESDSNPPPNIKIKKKSVNCYLFEKNNPFLLEKAKQANQDPIDFTNGLVDIGKHLVTFNHLPPTRYGEEFDEEKKIYLASYYQKLYQEIDAKNDPQLRYFLFEQLIINQMLRKEKNKDIHLSYYHKSTQIKHLSCDFRKLFSTTRT